VHVVGDHPRCGGAHRRHHTPRSAADAGCAKVQPEGTRRPADCSGRTWPANQIFADHRALSLELRRAQPHARGRNRARHPDEQFAVFHPRAGHRLGRRDHREHRTRGRGDSERAACWRRRSASGRPSVRAPAAVVASARNQARDRGFHCERIDDRSPRLAVPLLGQPPHRRGGRRRRDRRHDRLRRTERDRVAAERGRQRTGSDRANLARDEQDRPALRRRVRRALVDPLVWKHQHFGQRKLVPVDGDGIL